MSDAPKPLTDDEEARARMVRGLDMPPDFQDRVCTEYFRIDPIDGYKEYGDLSAVDPPYARRMQCDTCRTKWLGCWDNFTCPECGEGELPQASIGGKT